MGKIISISITVSIMALIFLFSSQGGGESSQLSLRVTKMAANIVIDGYNQMPEYLKETIALSLHGIIRKLAHFFIYTSLGASMFTSAGYYVKSIRRRYLLTFTISAIYATTDEVHQLFTQGRAGMITDVLIDSAGAAVGALAALTIFCVVFTKRNLCP